MEAAMDDELALKIGRAVLEMPGGSVLTRGVALGWKFTNECLGYERGYCDNLLNVLGDTVWRPIWEQD